MTAYVDPSLLTAVFVREVRSHEAAAQLADMKEPVALTPLQRHELRNAIRLAEFRGKSTRDEVRTALRLLDDREAAGLFVPTTPQWAEVYARADAISASHTPSQGNRALDILHVASALVLGAREFYTFDQDQADLARAVGLKVFPKR